MKGKTIPRKSSILSVPIKHKISRSRGWNSFRSKKEVPTTNRYRSQKLFYVPFPLSPPNDDCGLISGMESDLPRELWYEILLFCDIPSIFALSSLCPLIFSVAQMPSFQQEFLRIRTKRYVKGRSRFVRMRDDKSETIQRNGPCIIQCMKPYFSGYTTGFYLNDMKQGLWRSYDDDTSLVISETLWDKGDIVLRRDFCSGDCSDLSSPCPHLLEERKRLPCYLWVVTSFRKDVRCQVDVIGDNGLIFRTSFSDDGSLCGEENRHQDLGSHGPSWFYHPDGSLESFGTFRRGKRHGIWKYYYPSSSIPCSYGISPGGRKFNVGPPRLYEKWYKGKLSGPFVEYYSNRQMMRSGSYHAGLPSGTWKRWWPDDSPNETGQLQSIAEYSDGELSGVSRKYYPAIGRDEPILAEEALYEDGLLVSLKSWFPNGRDQQLYLSSSE